MSQIIVDIPELKDRIDGDKDLFFEIADVFFTDFAIHQEAIAKALSENNPDKVKEHAHTVKGALSNLSVKKGAALAFELETAGRQKDLSESSNTFKSLLDEVADFKKFVEEVRLGKHWD